MPNYNPFDQAPIKKEGEPFNPFGYTDEELAAIPKPKYDTTWVEVRVPINLEEEAYQLIDSWLESKGIDLKEL